MSSDIHSSDIYTAALSLLARRDHSQKELEQKLRSKFKVDVLELDVLLEALTVAGYLDDARFAESYTRSRTHKGFGPERIRQELRSKGVEGALIDQTLSSGDFNWQNLAQTAWRKKYHQLPCDFSERVKQANFLRYRGFNTDQCDLIFNENH